MMASLLTLLHQNPWPSKFCVIRRRGRGTNGRHHSTQAWFDQGLDVMTDDEDSEEGVQN